MLQTLAVIAIGAGAMVFVKISKQELLAYLDRIKFDWEGEGREDLEHLLGMVYAAWFTRALRILQAGVVTVMVGLLDGLLRPRNAFPATWGEAVLQLCFGFLIGMMLLCVSSLIFLFTDRANRDQLLHDLRTVIWENPSLLRTYEKLVNRAPAINDSLQDLHPLSYKHVQ